LVPKSLHRVETILTICLATSGLLLVVRMLKGPFRFFVPVNSPVNLESIFAVLVVGLLLAKSLRRPARALSPGPAPPTRRALFAASLAVVAVVTVALWPGLPLPLNTDDFTHLEQLSEPGATTPLRLLSTPSGGPGFFRPLVVLLYGAELRYAGISALPRHVLDLALHAGNSVLVLLLGLGFGLTLPVAVFAALLFGLHGTRPEAVCWMGARFDPMAAFFVLLCLLAFLRWVEKRRVMFYVMALLSCLCALLSKEAAYILPLLLTVCFGWRRACSRDGARALAPFYFLTALTFAYRWHVVGGIGGYNVGGPTIFQVSLIRTLRVLLLRVWAILWFPINWSISPEAGLTGATILLVMASCMFVWLARGSRRAWIGLAFVWISVLPVQHLLLIGSDLEKSRYLYIPSVGFALMVGIWLQSVESGRWRGAIAAAVLLFQFAAVRHNVAIWARVTEAGFQNCAYVASQVDSRDRPVALVGLPRVLDGVYNLRNGFSSCLALNFSVSNPVLVLDGWGAKDRAAYPSASVFQWDARLKRVVRGNFVDDFKP
jgi:hypothetical protein